MRRLSPILLLLALAGLAGPVAAQPRVGVSVALWGEDPPGGPRRALVYLHDLLADTRWNEQLDNSLPVIVTHRLELWRSRGLIDQLQGFVEWRLIITKEPLLEEYAVTQVTQDRPGRPERFAVRDSAARYLAKPNLIDFQPNRRGSYYYSLTTKITTLSEADMDQLERFLAGDPELITGDRGTVIGRTFRRILLSIAGRPSVELDAKSETFEVSRD